MWLALIAGGTYTDEHILLRLGDESIGVISAHHYSAALDTPANRRFRTAFEKKYNREATTSRARTQPAGATAL